MERSDDTAGQCCWPGQVWSRGRCVGIPTSCPAEMALDRARQSCEVQACKTGQTRADDNVHCCWPGQGWSRSRSTCVGIPQCPAGLEAEGDIGCVSPDKDGDGIPNKLDKCPDQAEDFNHYKDEDGCPDEPERLAMVAAQQQAANAAAAAQAATAAAQAAAAAAAAAAAEAASHGPPGTVKLNFKPKVPAEHWSLITKEGAKICDLPCSAWVPAGSGSMLQHDTPRADDIQKVPLPQELGYSPGTVVDATVNGPHGAYGGGLALIILGALAMAEGGGVGGAFACSSGSSLCAPALGLGIGLGGGMLTLGIVLMANASPRGDVILTLPGAQATTGRSLTVRPDFIGLESTSGTRLGLTRSGVGGTF